MITRSNNHQTLYRESIGGLGERRQQHSVWSEDEILFQQETTEVGVIVNIVVNWPTYQIHVDCITLLQFQSCDQGNAVVNRPWQWCSNVDSIHAKKDPGIFSSRKRKGSETKVEAAVHGCSKDTRPQVHCTANVQLRHFVRNHRSSGWIICISLHVKWHTGRRFDVQVANDCLVSWIIRNILTSLQENGKNWRGRNCCMYCKSTSQSSFTCRSLSFAEVTVDGLQLGGASFNRVEAADLVASNEQVITVGRFSRQCRPSSALKLAKGVFSTRSRGDTTKVQSSDW